MKEISELRKWARRRNTSIGRFIYVKQNILNVLSSEVVHKDVLTPAELALAQRAYLALCDLVAATKFLSYEDFQAQKKAEERSAANG